jgi:hypothetical protein
MVYKLTIGGISTYDDLGLLLTSAAEMDPPTPKTYMVDVPGSDGVIDLTEFAGDVAFGQRTQSFTFHVRGSSPSGFEQAKTRVSRLFHGRRLPFSLSWDHGWTYLGRWAIDSYATSRTGGTITLKVTADPYKTRDDSPMTWLVNAAGGVTLTLPVGRRRVCPTIQVQRTTLVSHGGRTWTLQPGASRIRDLWLSLGDDELTINTYPEYGIETWADDGTTATWADGQDGTWASEETVQDSPAWSADGTTEKWATDGEKRWIEDFYPAAATDEYAAYVQYDYQDL